MSTVQFISWIASGVGLVLLIVVGPVIMKIKKHSQDSTIVLIVQSIGMIICVISLIILFLTGGFN